MPNAWWFNSRADVREIVVTHVGNVQRCSLMFTLSKPYYYSQSTWMYKIHIQSFRLKKVFFKVLMTNQTLFLPVSVNEWNHYLENTRRIHEEHKLSVVIVTSCNIPHTATCFGFLSLKLTAHPHGPVLYLTFSNRASFDKPDCEITS